MKMPIANERLLGGKRSPTIEVAAGAKLASPTPTNRRTAKNDT